MESYFMLNPFYLPFSKIESSVQNKIDFSPIPTFSHYLVKPSLHQPSYNKLFHLHFPAFNATSCSQKAHVNAHSACQLCAPECNTLIRIYGRKASPFYYFFPQQWPVHLMPDATTERVCCSYRLYSGLCFRDFHFGDPELCQSSGNDDVNNGEATNIDFWKF